MNNGFAKLQTLKSNVNVVCEPLYGTIIKHFISKEMKKWKGLHFPVHFHKLLYFIVFSTFS